MAEKEYIEREAVAEMLENAQMITDGEYCGYCTEDVCLDNIPTDDVVEVVRCKDCNYFSQTTVNKKGFCICSVSGMEITDNDFCSYGENG